MWFNLLTAIHSGQGPTEIFESRRVVRHIRQAMITLILLVFRFSFLLARADTRYRVGHDLASAAWLPIVII